MVEGEHDAVAEQVRIFTLLRPMRDDAIFLIRLIAATLTARQNKMLMADNIAIRTDRDFYRDNVPPGTVLHFTDAWRLRYHLATRKVEVLGVTQHANEAYMTQVAREATADGGWLKQVGCRYLIHDGDGKFCEAWKGMLNSADPKVEPVQIPPHSPNCNAYAERWVRTAKHELTRRCRFLDYSGLCQALREYTDHFNAERPHQSLGNRPLTGNPGPHAAAQKIVAGFKPDQIRCVTRRGGVIKHYYRVAA